MDLSKRPIWLFPALSAVIALILGALIVSSQLNPAPREASASSVRTAEGVTLGGPFTLVNHEGETVTEETYRGTAMLVYFGFTYCPDMCPASLQLLKVALDELDADERAAFQPILISVDPERDTPESLAQYVSGSAFPENLVGLTGTLDQVRAAATGYGVYFSRVEDSSLTSGYTVDHVSVIFLMDRNGEFVDIFPHGTAPTVIAQRLQRFLQDNPVQS